MKWYWRECGSVWFEFFPFQLFFEDSISLHKNLIKDMSEARISKPIQRNGCPVQHLLQSYTVTLFHCYTLHCYTFSLLHVTLLHCHTLHSYTSTRYIVTLCYTLLTSYKPGWAKVWSIRLQCGGVTGQATGALYQMLCRDKGKSFIRAKFHIAPLALRYCVTAHLSDHHISMSLTVLIISDNNKAITPLPGLGLGIDQTGWEG